MLSARFARLITATATVVAGAGFIAAAAVPRAWVESHFLPDFTMSDTGRVAREVLIRAATAFIGLALLALARRVLRLKEAAESARFVGQLARIAVAVVLALGTCELLLATVYADLFDELRSDRRPSRRPDSELGWVHVPNLAEEVMVAGRGVQYAMDDNGNRIDGAYGTEIRGDLKTAGATIVIAGESFAFGYKLPWAESVAGQLEALSGAAVVNAAVEGYSSAQAYLRLKRELPRVEHPVAVVTVFLPTVFKKMLDRRRPYLDAELHWHTPEHPLLLAVLGRWLAPYNSTAEIEDGVATARAVLRASAALAQERGATPLILVPQVLPEEPAVAALRRHILDDAGIAYVLVPLKKEWHVPDDPHPDARGARAMAEAISAALTQKKP